MTRAAMRLLTLTTLAFVLAAPTAYADMRVSHLRVERLEDPLGLDARAPRLSWQLESSERAQVQTAYQVLVSTGDGRTVWDSGKVESDRSIDVVYDGPALRSGTRYHWKVRVWDRNGERSGWSRPGTWEMGLLEPSDWRADWIGRPKEDLSLDFDGAHWIWYPEGNPAQSAPAGTRYFRLRFDVPADRQVVRATLTATADNQFTAYLNGNQVASGTDWTRAARVDVTDRLTPGSNLLALSATNLGGPGAIIARLRVEFASGEPVVVDTGDAFKAANAEEPGWQTPGHDDSAWPAALEAAAFGDPPWGRQVTVPRPSPVAQPLLRKEFDTDRPIARARAYVSGIGYYVLRINGRRIGDRVLDPAYTEYEDTVLYSAYDVTHELRRGRNALAVALGSGFYYYDAPKLLMQVVIDYADGSRSIAGTDDTWRLTSGPTSLETERDNAVFAGETYDARRDPRGWDRPGFDDAGWEPAPVVPAPGGRLVAQGIEPVTATGSVEPTEVAEPKPGIYVLDMGRTLTGWIRLRAAGKDGSKASIQYGEKLNPDGTVNDVPSPGPRPHWQRDEYVFRGDGVETWEPSFTFKSFRYVQLTGLAAPPDDDTVRGREVHSSVRDVGEFSASNPLYGQIHRATRRTALNMLVGFPALDPGHEKNGWTGDTQLMAPSMTYDFDVGTFLAKWLGDIRDGQRPDGSLSMINPIRDGCCYAWAPEWTGAYPIVAWELYVRYGDRRVLEEHYDALKRNLAWQTGSLQDGLAPPSTWGDWFSPGFGVGPEDRRLTATAYVYRQAVVMADVARVLGHTADAAAYRERADALRNRFNQAFLNEEEGRYETPTDPGYRQASNAIPLAFGMVPEQQRAAVLAGLVADVRARGNHLNTGILGTPALLESLTRNGHAGLAHAIAGQTTYPSWGQWIQAGADTLWESWGLETRSKNHPMHGTIEAWFYRDVAGIAPDPRQPGYKHVLIEPHPGPLSEAHASHESPYGEIEVAWVVRDGRFTLDVRIPPNTTATVRLPNGGSEEIGSGRYRFHSAL